MNPIRNFNKAGGKRDISNGVKRVFLVFFLFFISCSPLEVNRLFGVGLRRFREEGKIYTEAFNADLPFCYGIVVEKLNKMRASFYRGSQKEGFIVFINFVKAFPQCNASTEVAIFFTELKSFKTEVEVASLNYSLAEFAAAEIFNHLKSKEIGDIKLDEEVGLEQRMD
ncbi:MAG: hypothetical protein P9M02_03605 [Candidatus Susulua stagnicola]|nr:hypothetical protein [Candidatus Susulua stagnicola]